MSSVLRGGGSAPRAHLGGWSKRSLDLIGASLVICALSPLLLLTAMLIRLSGRPVLVSTTFVGAKGRACRARRFRTAPIGSPVPGRSEPTPLARWLRDSGIADLPMLMNVIKGDMSLVGPCPRDAAEMTRLGSAALDLLHARPGIISPSKLAEKQGVSFSKGLALDRDYVRRYTSIQDDLRLIARATLIAEPA